MPLSLLFLTCPDLLKDVPQFSIREVTEGVQIIAHGATEEHWVLGNDGHLLSEVVQPNLLCVHPVNGDGSKWLGHSVEYCQERGLPSTCTTHNANLRRLEMEMWLWFEQNVHTQHTLYLLRGFDVEVEGLEHKWEFGRILEGHILEYNFPLLWPHWWWFLLWWKGL